MQFEFAKTTKIIFGSGASANIGSLAAEFGNRAFIITSATIKRAQPILDNLKAANIDYATYPVKGEPTIDITADAADQARAFKSRLVIGIGGGSPIDTGKAVAALMTNPGNILEYLEVVGEGKPIKNPPVPYIAIPTTAGTGAEVTRNAVLTVPQKQVKVSMRSPLILPRLAIVDPQLTLSLPKDITAYTGLDALTQLIEAFVSIKANPLTDSICTEGIKRAARALPLAYNNRSDLNAREDMSLASLFSGLALANAGLGAVHGFAGPLGAMIKARHGEICGRLLPYVTEANIKALQKRESQSPALNKYKLIAQLVTEDNDGQPADLINWLYQLCSSLNTRSLSQFGLTKEVISDVVAKAQNANSMKGNPIKLTPNELTGILEKAIS